jgi:hypothetical protein
MKSPATDAGRTTRLDKARIDYSDIAPLGEEFFWRRVKGRQ